LLEEIAKRGVAIFMVEQKLTIALMGHGKIVYEGSPAAVKAAADVRQEWLQV